MKIRLGFVSNSSSTSFCIYGTLVRFEDLKDPKTSWYSIKELEVHRYLDMPSDEAYVGRSYSSIGLDETGRQLIADVENKVKDLVKDGTKLEFSTIEEAWYNG